MVAFLSQDWLDAQRDATSGLPPSPGASAVVQYVVNGTPAGNVSYFTTYTDGGITAAELGSAPADPDLTFTLTFSDAAGLARGDIDLSAAYMQGTLKAEGSMRVLFALLPATHRPEYRAAITAVGDKTDF